MLPDGFIKEFRELQDAVRKLKLFEVPFKAKLIGLPAYANNAAALAAGLTAGDLYVETGTDPRRVCVVY